jgi:putative ABC transport system substrate-binding protein
VKFAALAKRREVLFAIGASVLASGPAFAQTAAGKVWRIGILCSSTPEFMADRIEGLRTGLQKLGYVEGKNLVIDARFANGNEELLAELAASLVRQNVDLIVANTIELLAAKRTTSTLPIVVPASADLVAMGVADSLSHPGGNVTGQQFFMGEIAAKRAEFLKAVIPALAEVALLYADSAYFDTRGGPRLMPAGVAKLNLKALPFEARSSDAEFQEVFSAMARQHVRAVTFYDHTALVRGSKAIADQALKHRIAAAGSPEFADAGGLIGYGVRFPELWSSAARFIDRIFKGSKPGDIPIEQVTRFEFVLNLRTANLLGVKFPRTMWVRADRIIE